MSSSVIISILALLLTAAVLALVFVLLRHIKEMKDMQGKEGSVSQIMNQNLQAMHERLDKAAHYIGSLGQELRSMQTIGKNIEDLRAAFFSPKLRGNFGEQVLNDALSDHFPHEQYETQYRFKDGQAVDAVIKTKDGLIPVDSKFPIDNFRKMVAAATEQERDFERNEFMKAVRKHIGDIAKKYIMPDEGTTAFAVMYVPSEAIYYEIISSTDELSELARSKNVLMTSPNSFAYFLHILRLGHERIRIEENVQKVWHMLSGLQQETQKFGDVLGVLSTHLTNAKNQMDRAHAEYGKLSARFDQIKDLRT